MIHMVCVDSTVGEHQLCIPCDLGSIPEGYHERIFSGRNEEAGETVAYQPDYILSGEFGNSCNSCSWEHNLLVMTTGHDYSQIWEAVIALRAINTLLELAQGNLLSEMDSQSLRTLLSTHQKNALSLYDHLWNWLSWRSQSSIGWECPRWRSSGTGNSLLQLVADPLHISITFLSLPWVLYQVLIYR